MSRPYTDRLLAIAREQLCLMEGNDTLVVVERRAAEALLASWAAGLIEACVEEMRR